MENQNPKFEVAIGNFAGPLDALLSLIEERKLSINDVALARVADDFLHFVERLPAERPADQTMSILADFLVVASTLMLIKSRSLLPNLELSGEEEGQIVDLERRLKFYQLIKEASVDLGQRFGQSPIFWHERQGGAPVFTPAAEVSLESLRLAMERVLASLPIKESLPEVMIKKVMSLEEMIKDLSTRIQASFKTSFHKLVGDKKEKANLIVGFLAMLELVKRGLIAVEQNRHFDDISIQTREAGVPKY